MELRITGPQRLNGEITVSGAKNSATRVLAAAMLSEGHVSLRQFPLTLVDAREKMKFLARLGAQFSEDPLRNVLSLNVNDLSVRGEENFNVPIRTTYLLAGGLLARGNLARIPYPGGCKIGSRGYDLHMMIWEKLGCEVEEKPDYIEIRGHLRGGTIDFPISTVGGTENALICGAVASGETLVRNAYVTPEVNDLIRFLREMGAQIQQEGQSLLRIEGAGGLLKGASFSIMPDRIEALTWMILGAVTGGSVMIRNVPMDSLEVPMIHLRDAGLDLFRNTSDVFVSPACVGPHGLQPFELATGTHPGVISDMQSFFAFLGLFANGRSVVFDYRYPERIAYARELAKFAPGAISASPGQIKAYGPAKLTAAQVTSTDLRGSMALIMAAICAEGESRVYGVDMAMRGYDNLPAKLAALGVDAQWSK